MLISNKVKEKIMPDHILLDDIIDDMIDEISYIKLSSYLNFDDEKKNFRKSNCVRALRSGVAFLRCMCG